MATTKRQKVQEQEGQEEQEGGRSCGSCRSWQEVDDRGGECRRHAPPALILTIAGHDPLPPNDWRTRWPLTRAADWCVEYEARPS